MNAEHRLDDIVHHNESFHAFDVPAYRVKPAHSHNNADDEHVLIELSHNYSAKKPKSQPAKFETMEGTAFLENRIV